MERRKALITAAIISGAVFVASAAIGLNVGLLSSNADEDPVGELQADDLVSADVSTSTTTSTPEPVTVVVDDYVTDPGAAGASPAAPPGTAESVPPVTPGVPSASAPGGSSPSAPTSQVAPAPSFGDDHGEDDDHDEHEDHDEHDDDEYEGHDDDD